MIAIVCNKKEKIFKTAEYLTYIASNVAKQNTFEVRYEDKNIWLTQK